MPQFNRVFDFYVASAWFLLMIMGLMAVMLWKRRASYWSVAVVAGAFLGTQITAYLMDVDESSMILPNVALVALYALYVHALVKVERSKEIPQSEGGEHGEQGPR